MKLLSHRIADKRIVQLLGNIVQSFSSSADGIGLPLGNLTSQLLANVYMNELDQFVKHKLHARYYIRYADDFVLLSQKKAELIRWLYAMDDFLIGDLHLFLHPAKVHLKTVASGMDFLGWVHFPNHRVLRTSTKRRMQRAITGDVSEPIVSSYLGMLTHGNAYQLSQMLEK